MLTPSRFPHEPFTAADLRSIEIPRGDLRTALADGRVRRVLRGVYVEAHLEDTVSLRVAAARRVIASGSVVRDRTAAWLHGVDALSWAETEVLPPIETCVRRFEAPTRRAGVDGRTRDLLPRDVMDLDGVLVTTPLRTAIDLGCNLKRRSALASMDALSRLHGLERSQFFAELPRFRGRRGVRQVRPLVPLVDWRRESQRESWTALAISDAGLPAPEPQYWIEIGGVPVWRLDFAYPRHRIAIEYDGEEWHDRTPEQRKNDRDRRDWMRKDGWIIIVVTKAELGPDGPGAWIQTLTEALGDRATTMRRWVAPH